MHKNTMLVFPATTGIDNCIIPTEQRESNWSSQISGTAEEPLQRISC